MPESSKSPVRATPPSTMSLGARLRVARRRAGITMRELAAEIGVSQPFLSQVETDKAMPSVATLTMIARRLGTSVDALVAPENLDQRTTVSRASEGGAAHLAEVPDSTVRRLVRGVPQLEIVEIRAPSMPATWCSRSRSHPGTEIIYIVEGNLTVETEGSAPELLNEGDSISFDSGRRHLWRAAGARSLVVLCVMLES